MKNSLSLPAVLLAALLAAPAAAQSTALPQPTPGLMPNPAKGRTLFEAKCASCHGAQLEGSRVGPPLLHPYYKPDHHSDLAFQMAIRNGVRAHHWQFGNMPPVPGINADEAAHVIAYIRGRQRASGLLD